MKTITIEIQRGEGDGQHSIFETLYLDTRIYCPHCGVAGAIWVDDDAYEDNAGALCLCVACGYDAYGIDKRYSSTLPSNLHVARINAIKEQANVK